MVRVSDAFGGADEKVLDKIVHYTTKALSIVLMAKYDNLKTDCLIQVEELGLFELCVQLETRRSHAIERDSFLM